MYTMKNKQTFKVKKKTLKIYNINKLINNL